MKKLLVALLLLAMLATPILTFAYESNPSGIIVGGTAYVFENNPPLLGEPPIGTIPNGAEVVVYSTSGDFRRVGYFTGYGGHLTGWVDRNQVRIVASPTAQPTAQPTARPTAKPTAKPTRKPTAKPAATKLPDPLFQAVVISETLIIRATPADNGKKVYTMSNGAVVDILEMRDDWYHITHKANNKKTYTGWVPADFILTEPSYIVTSVLTNAYTLPNLDSKLIEKVEPDTVLLVLGEVDDFYVVNLNHGSAFISKADIEAEG